MLLARSKMLLATSLLLGLAVNISNAADQPACQLSHGALQTQSAMASLATMNTLCPIGTGNFAQGSVCLPCVCGALELFHDALAESRSANQRFGTSQSLSVPETADLLNTCIDANADKFSEFLQVRAGLSDCLSIKGLFSDSTKLEAICGNYVAEATYGGDLEAVVEAYETDDSSINLSTVDSNVNYEAENRRFMQEDSTSGPYGGFYPPQVGGFYPPGYGGLISPPYPPSPPGVYGGYGGPPGVYGSPAPPYGPGGVIITGPPPGAFTPPSPGEYSPPSPSDYSPPSPGAYTPPSPSDYTPPSPGNAIGATPPNAINTPPGVVLAPPPSSAGLTGASLMPLAVALLCALLMGAMVM